jgi:hypothetical protein
MKLDLDKELIFVNTTPCGFDLALAYTLLHMARALASAIKFVHQILAPLSGSCLFLWKSIFFCCLD